MGSAGSTLRLAHSALLLSYLLTMHPISSALHPLWLKWKTCQLSQFSKPRARLPATLQSDISCWGEMAVAHAFVLLQIQNQPGFGLGISLALA